MRGYDLVSDLADSRFVIHFRDPQGLYSNVLPFEYSQPNIGKAAGSVRPLRKIELVG